MSHTDKVADDTTQRERLGPLVLPDTAARLRVWSAAAKKSQGELIDELVQAHLPPAPSGAEGGRS